MWLSTENREFHLKELEKGQDLEIKEQDFSACQQKTEISFSKEKTQESHHKKIIKRAQGLEAGS